MLLNAKILFAILIRNLFLLFWTKLFHIRLMFESKSFFIDFLKFLVASLIRKLYMEVAASTQGTVTAPLPLTANPSLTARVCTRQSLHVAF